MLPAMRSRRSGGRQARVPTIWAKTPPRWMSATRTTGASAYSAMGMLTMSVPMRFISAQDPAPSITTRSNSARSRSRAAAASAKRVCLRA